MVDQHSEAVEAKLVLEVLLRKLWRTAGTGNSILLIKIMKQNHKRYKNIMVQSENKIGSFVDSFDILIPNALRRSKYKQT